MPSPDPVDPLLLALANAPEDDEPWTDEDEAAVAESRADFAAGRTLTHEEMLQMIDAAANLPDELRADDDCHPYIKGETR